MIFTFLPIFSFNLTFLFRSLKDFRDFADVIESVKDKGVVASVASPDDVEAANKERPNFFQVKNVL